MIDDEADVDAVALNDKTCLIFRLLLHRTVTFNAAASDRTVLCML